MSIHNNKPIHKTDKAMTRIAFSTYFMTKYNPKKLVEAFGVVDDEVGEGGPALGVTHGGDDAHGLVDGEDDVLRPTQIGRASCRERV